jgi:bifunctional hydroxylase/dehydrase
MSPTDSSAQVVIAGAGPTGLMLAAELRLAGITALVLERQTATIKQSRALAMHARTVEVLDQRGIAQRLTGRMQSRGHFAEISLDFSVLDGNHAGVMLIEQWRTEQILTQWAEELGVEIRRGHEVINIVEQPDAIEVAVRGPDGDYTVTGHYLVGADGGRSTVRKLLGVEFPGTDSTIEALVSDVAGLQDLPRGFHRFERGDMAVFPLEDDMTRIMAFVHGTGPRRRQEPPTFAELVANIHLISGDNIDHGKPSWISSFGNASRQASHYRRGRTFLAGDAAHIHSPFGGQGLNLGVQHAVNLGWKLGATVNGWTPEALLDTYHSERHAVAERVLLNTRAQDPLIGGPEVEPLREYLGEIFAIPEVNRRIAGEMSAIDIRYDVGPGTHPLLGKRLPWHELQRSSVPTSTTELLHPARGLLIDLADNNALRDIAHPWADRVDVITATTTTLNGTDALLVRPDGYIAWTSPGGGDLQQALAYWFGELRATTKSGGATTERTHNTAPSTASAAPTDDVESAQGEHQAITERAATTGRAAS